ncbi:MAG: hypothetical protein J6X18_02635 [Bacteroidales bacterium]|nr:hypothetical protein [Bacteroidales bacterium]
MPSSSTYGIVKPSVVTADDVDIFYNYKPFRNSEEVEYSTWKKLDSNLVFSPVELESSEIADKRLPGMYSMKLPVSVFGQKGYYTVYIKPKEVRCKIADIGTLLAYPDIRGLVIDTDSLDSGRSLFNDDSLTGYRVEYFGYQGDVLYRQDYHRIVTSSNLCEIVSSHQYRFNSSSSLSFVTVTPSTAPSFKANAKPFIGIPNQEIAFVNTKFDPVTLDIHMVEHDIETLSIMAQGEQVRNLDNGRVTTYNFDGEPYYQAEFVTIKDNYTGTNIAEVKFNVTGAFDNSASIQQFRNV